MTLHVCPCLLYIHDLIGLCYLHHIHYMGLPQLISIGYFVVQELVVVSSGS